MLYIHSFHGKWFGLENLKYPYLGCLTFFIKKSYCLRKLIDPSGFWRQTLFWIIDLQDNNSGFMSKFFNMEIFFTL